MYWNGFHGVVRRMVSRKSLFSVILMFTSLKNQGTNEPGAKEPESCIHKTNIITLSLHKFWPIGISSIWFLSVFKFLLLVKLFFVFFLFFFNFNSYALFFSAQDFSALFVNISKRNTQSKGKLTKPTHRNRT